MASSRSRPTRAITDHRADSRPFSVEHLVFGIDDPETYYYRLAYLDNLRAAQYLFSRPDVDPARVAAEGGSQGGLFAIALAVMEPRIAAVASNITAITAIGDGLILNQRGTTQSLRTRLDAGDASTERVQLSLSYIDGANMATRVRVPVQVNVGGQDPICHFVTGLIIGHRLPTGVRFEYNLFPDIRHEVPAAVRQANARWYQEHLRLDHPPQLPGTILRPPRP